MAIKLIAAVSPQGIIGYNSANGSYRLAWDPIREDFLHFKTTTKGNGNNRILMGRKTFDSLPGVLRDRQTIVLTRDNSFKRDGVLVAHSLDEALEVGDQSGDLYVCGGAEVYKLALNSSIVKELIISHINPEYKLKVPNADDVVVTFPYVLSELRAHRIEYLKDFTIKYYSI